MWTVRTPVFLWEEPSCIRKDKKEIEGRETEDRERSSLKELNLGVTQYPSSKKGNVFQEGTEPGCSSVAGFVEGEVVQEGNGCGRSSVAKH